MTTVWGRAFLVLGRTWPAQSSDLDPIHHLWDELEHRLGANAWSQVPKCCAMSSPKSVDCRSSMSMHKVLEWHVQQSHVCQMFTWVGHVVYSINMSCVLYARIPWKNMPLRSYLEAVKAEDDAASLFKERPEYTNDRNCVLQTCRVKTFCNHLKYLPWLQTGTSCRDSVFVNMNIRQFCPNPTCAPCKSLQTFPCSFHQCHWNANELRGI